MQGKPRQKQEVLRDIERGTYRDCYLVYNRKSTDDTDNQKNSIKYQRSENLRFAAHERLPIAALTLEGFATDGIVSERHSGFAESLELKFGHDNTVQYRVGRPKFHQLTRWLSQGNFKGVIILCWDRASRNKTDDTTLRKLMKAGVDIRFALAHYDNTSAGALHMDIDGMFAEHHSRVTSEKVAGTKRSLRAQGICTFRAPVGYLNLGGMYDKPVDPERAPIIKRLFELAAAGDWTLADLARWAIEQGFTMHPMRRRRTEEEILAEEDDDVRLEIQPISRLPTFTSIHKILTNPFYAGMIMGNDGVPVQSVSHRALVSRELFNEVQKQLRSRRQSAHYIEPVDLPFRGMFRCAVCRRVYTPYEKKGITYYGARCKAGCSNSVRSVNFNFLSDKVAELMGRLTFTKEEKVFIDARALTDLALMEAKHLEQFEESLRQHKKLQEDLKYLHDNRLMLLRTGAYAADAYVAEEMRLSAALQALKNREDAKDVALDETVKNITTLSELIENAKTLYKKAMTGEKDRITRIMFSEFTLSGNVVDFKCTKGVQPLADRFLPTHDPIGWLSELCVEADAIRASIRELKHLLAAGAMVAQSDGSDLREAA